MSHEHWKCGKTGMSCCSEATETCDAELARLRERLAQVEGERERLYGYRAERELEAARAELKAVWDTVRVAGSVSGKIAAEVKRMNGAIQAAYDTALRDEKENGDD